MTPVVSLFLMLTLPGALAAHEGDHDRDHNNRSSRQALQRIAENALHFLNALSPEQTSKARYVFDDEKRFVYRTIPFSIPGLQLGEMTPGQRALFHSLLAASLSTAGYTKTTSIIALEEILVEMEGAGGTANPAHGAGKYSVAIFGEPSVEGTWSWRMHGHHLYLSFTVIDGRFFASGPAFFGAEPHRIEEGAHKGWRVLGNEEDLGRALIQGLESEQRAKAVLSQEVPRDLFSGSYSEFRLEGEPQGISYRELSAENRLRLRELVSEYVNNIPAELRVSRLGRIEAGGWDAVHFAWMGSIAPGARNYYRVQGPEFLIEYCAVALTENHVHSVWREFNGDFGRDLLKEHYEAFPH
jgi:hypothetical protein